MSSSGEDGRESKDRRETILQRRDRVLGTRSLRYVHSSEKSPTPPGAGNKRRGQILQAQRAHRQRTLDYIAELENEVFRLRDTEATLTSKLQDHATRVVELPTPEIRIETKNTITLHVLIQCLNGQLAPGLWMTEEKLADIKRRVPAPYPSPLELSDEYLSNYRSLAWEPASDLELASTWSPSFVSPGLESHDALTRMLFLNFSENIAPTLVAFDGISNGYRSFMLPLACEDDLVRCALLASSANHLRFRRPKLTNLALNFQSAAIEKLSFISASGNCASETKPAILAAIILLLINGMMNGGSDFELLLNMAKSWIEAMNGKTSLKEIPGSALDEFLLDQISMMQLYAQPLLKEQTIILSQYDCYSPDFSAGNFTFSDRMHQIFSSLESAIKQACTIYSFHILNDGPLDDIEEILDTLKNTVGGIPNHTPGENALAWVYFIAAAESSTASKRTFFAKRLMGVYERGTFTDVTTAFTVLHQIWGFQGTGNSWTNALMQMPLVLK